METLPARTRFQIGVDLAEVDRIASSLEKFGDKFKERNFRAAKEAFLKAVGIGIMRGIPMSALSILPPPGRTRPVLEAAAAAREALAERHVVAWDLNITHSRSIAVAAAVVFFSD
jgi:holo-[acyl-carrier protein] synthase